MGGYFGRIWGGYLCVFVFGVEKEMSYIGSVNGEFIIDLLLNWVEIKVSCFYLGDKLGL